LRRSMTANTSRTCRCSSGSMGFLGCRDRLWSLRQRFVACRSCLPAQLIESRPHRDPIEPSRGPVALSPRMPPQLPEHFDCQFLGSGRIANHARNGTGRAVVVGMKERFEIKRAAGGLLLSRCFRESVHILNNTGQCGFVTNVPISGINPASFGPACGRESCARCPAGARPCSCCRPWPTGFCESGPLRRRPVFLPPSVARPWR
jgi:hypothetical protein